MMQERLEELLVERALVGTADAERSELTALLTQHPQLDADAFDRAAAAAALVFLAEENAAAGGQQQLPPGLRDKIRRSAHTHIPAALATTPPSDLPEPKPLPFRPPAKEPEITPARWSVGGAAGWLVAVAAVLIALVGWWPRLSSPAPAETPPVTVDEPPSRLDRVAAASDVTVLPWNPTDDAAARQAGGEVAWSTTLQEGYMRIRGLTANDPGSEQYQLWIFDAERDDRYPVDGGVFDIPAGTDEVIVPIEAKLPVDRPVLFAVTVEPPGGVVVSSRERIVLAAQAG